MEAIYSSETCVDFQWTAERFTPEDETAVRASKPTFRASFLVWVETEATIWPNVPAQGDG
jgi:hypothetical protein